MSTTVVFDYQLWIKRYPEFCSVPEDQATAYFDEACLDPLASRVLTGGRADENKLIILNMLTAHIAKIYATVNGQAPSGLVGRITDASEGTVSVAVDKFQMPASAQWYAQTTYGFAFWQATRYLRTARYIPGIRPIPPGAPFGGGRWGR